MERKKPKIDFDYASQLNSRLTKRDMAIILAVSDHRFLRLDQIRRLFFPSMRYAQMRMKTLYEMDFLDRIRLPRRLGEGTSPYIYRLGRAGADFVAAQRGIGRTSLRREKRNNQVELMFLEHTLAVSEFYVELREAEKRDKKAKLLEWVPDKEIKSYFSEEDIGKGTPDAYFKLGIFEHELNDFIDFDFFLEVDMGTMRSKNFADKIKKYIYLASSESREYWLGGFPTVLIVATTENRLATLRRVCERTVRESGSHLKCLLTTQKELGGNVEGNIWQKIFSDSRYSLVT